MFILYSYLSLKFILLALLSVIFVFSDPLPVFPSNLFSIKFTISCYVSSREIFYLLLLLIMNSNFSFFFLIYPFEDSLHFNLPNSEYFSIFLQHHILKALSVFFHKSPNFISIQYVILPHLLEHFVESNI